MLSLGANPAQHSLIVHSEVPPICCTNPNESFLFNQAHVGVEDNPNIVPGAAGDYAVPSAQHRFPHRSLP